MFAFKALAGPALLMIIGYAWGLPDDKILLTEITANTAAAMAFFISGIVMAVSTSGTKVK